MLNKEQIVGFKIKLERKLHDLKKQVKEVEIPPEFGTDTDHFEEKGDEAEALSTNLGISKTLRGRIEDIEHALTKIASGKYGLCEKCGGKIELGILEIDPESRLCKSCKKQPG